MLSGTSVVYQMVEKNIGSQIELACMLHICVATDAHLDSNDVDYNTGWVGSVGMSMKQQFKSPFLIHKFRKH